MSDEPSAFDRLYDDTIGTPADADIAEDKLRQEPNDINTRAQLIHYYYNLACKAGSEEICQSRLRHICWFIKNQPDMEFCGTAPFYIRAADPYFETVKLLWQEAIDCAPFEMRRINACIYLVNVDRSEGLDLLNKFLPDSNNIWVMALRDLLSGSKNCFYSLIESEGGKSVGLDNDSYKTKLLCELEGTQNWDGAALCGSSSVTPDDFAGLLATEFDSTISFNTAAKIAGCSVFRFESNSILGCNPEVISLRFKLACWIIRQLPFTQLARSPIFMGPFESVKSYHLFEQRKLDSLMSLVEFVAEHWTIQLRAFPQNKTIAKNAAIFVVGANPIFSNAAQIVISALSATSVGKAALRREDII